MKKLFTMAAVAVLGLSNVNAQEVNFGAKAGVNLATLTGDETDDLESRTGFHVGVVAEMVISDKFSFQPELMYSAQGTKSSYSESETFNGFTSSYEGESTLKLDYINLPLMAKYYVAEGFSIEAGPQIGFLINSEEEYEYSETFDGTTDTESGSDDLEDIKSIDFGLNFGIGYKLESGLNFGARYNLGLSNVNDSDDSDDFKINNSVVQVSVGFFF
ncbi:porin family protein [Olleya sp. HaHaR_3_96]|uniref:porin family protein n=1 Tax=Olleya sp. HaHaR_3_96 TaxID=2745560 RepID=UPI001C4ED4B3|nr:porin family protein [Olleya sp. HaHaR_3_96]QXP59127.1 PorT family protein [Olleya sp. HaHaR_3_96]